MHFYILTEKVLYSGTCEATTIFAVFTGSLRQEQVLPHSLVIILLAVDDGHDDDEDKLSMHPNSDPRRQTARVSLNSQVSMSEQPKLHPQHSKSGNPNPKPQ